MTEPQQGDCRTNGRWTKVEHEKFLLGIELYGKNWKKIEELVGTRTGSQIRSHAQKFFLKTQKSTSEPQPCPMAHENQESNQSATVISKQCSNSEENESQHSYFMNKIIKATSQNQDLNFWEYFIDVGSSKVQRQKLDVKRKDSFVAFDSCNDSKQDTTLYYGPTIGESIL